MVPIFGVQLAREVARIDEIAEEHRNLSSFRSAGRTGSGRLRGEAGAAAAAEFRKSRVARAARLAEQRDRSAAILARAFALGVLRIAARTSSHGVPTVPVVEPDPQASRTRRRAQETRSELERPARPTSSITCRPRPRDVADGFSERPGHGRDWFLGWLGHSGTASGGARGARACPAPGSLEGVRRSRICRRSRRPSTSRFARKRHVERGFCDPLRWVSIDESARPRGRTLRERARDSQCPGSGPSRETSRAAYLFDCLHRTDFRAADPRRDGAEHAAGLCLPLRGLEARG